MKTKLITLFVVLMGVLNTFGQNFYVTPDSSAKCITGQSMQYFNLAIGDDGLKAFYCRNIYWDIDFNANDPKAFWYYIIAGSINSKTRLLDMSQINIQSVSCPVGTTSGSYYDAMKLANVHKLLFGDVSTPQRDSMYATISMAIEYPANELPVYTFARMGYLTQIILPKTLTKVNMNAFIGCKNLDSLVIPSTTFVPSTEKLSTVFNRCYLAANRVLPPLTVYVPANLVDTYKADEYWGELDIQPIINPVANLSLETIKTEFGSMIPSYSKDIHKYTVVVPFYSTRNPIITAIAENKDSVDFIQKHGLIYVINPFPPKYDTAYVSNIHTGAKIYETILISKITRDNVYNNTDTIVFEFDSGDDATLKTLKFDRGRISPAFSPTIYSYTLYVENRSIPTIMTEVVKNDSNATFGWIDWNPNYGGGIYVISPSGNSNIYHIVIENEPQTTDNNAISDVLKPKILSTVVNSELNISGIEQGEISIIDLSGNTVLKTKAESQINVSSLSKGMYMVLVDDNCIGKIIKR